MAIVGIYPANTVDDDIEIYADDTRKKMHYQFYNLRNQEQKTDGSPNLLPV